MPNRLQLARDWVNCELGEVKAHGECSRRVREKEPEGELSRMGVVAPGGPNEAAAAAAAVDKNRRRAQDRHTHETNLETQEQKEDPAVSGTAISTGTNT